MSDTPRSFDELAPKSRADQVAWEYADHIWLETLFKQRQELLGAAIQAVVNSFDSEIEDKIAGRPNDLTDEDFAVVNTWKTSMEQKQAGWASRTLALGQSRIEIDAAYQEHRTNKGQTGLEPSYIIDPTEPGWRLTFQREYAVEREARMIDRLGLKADRFAAYKATAKGRYYVDCAPPSEDPDVSLKTECQAIKAYLTNTYGETMDEYEPAYQDKPWIPENMTRWLNNRRRNGRYAYDEHWWDVQKKMGYWLPEVIMIAVVTQQEVAEVKFYEENKVDRAPRRLVRPNPLQDLDRDGDDVREEHADDEQRYRDQGLVDEKHDSDDVDFDGEIEDESPAVDENQEEGRNLGFGWSHIRQ